MSAGNEEAIATEEEIGLQLSQWLAKLDSIPSRNKAKQILDSGKVRLNGEWATLQDAGCRILVGDKLEVFWSRPGSAKAQSAASKKIVSAGLEVLHEDGTVIAINKPSGLLTDTATKQQARERDSARKMMQAYLKPQKKRPVLVHRIDRDTSGVVLFAKNPAAADRIKEGFRERTIGRFYWVAVQGGPKEDEGTWEDEVYWDGKKKVLRRAHPDQRDRKQARAHFKVISRYEDVTLLEVELDTGKRNQIRFQCQQRGYPLCGERLYTPREWHRLGPECPRQALHAKRLEFPHPNRPDDRIVVEARLPADLALFVKGLS